MVGSIRLGLLLGSLVSSISNRFILIVLWLLKGWLLFILLSIIIILSSQSYNWHSINSNISNNSNSNKLYSNSSSNKLYSSNMMINMIVFMIDLGIKV